MRQNLFLITIVVAAYGLLLVGGCKTQTPPEDTQALDVQHEDEAEHAEQVPPEDPLEDTELIGQPPEVQEFIKAATIDQALDMIAEQENAHGVEPDLVVSYVYRHAEEADRLRIEQTVSELARTSDSPAIRQRSLGLLANFENDYFDLRVQAARSDSNDEVRMAAITGLITDGARAMPVLRELTNDPNPAVRQIAQDIVTQAMSRLGDDGIIELVEQLGLYRNDASALASTALVVRGEVALPYLVDAAMNDPNRYRRAAAASCIAMICAGSNPYLDEFARRAQATKHEDMAAIGHPANPAGIEPLLYVLQNDTYGPAREIAAQGLGYLGSEKAVPALAEALSDPDAAVRRRAAAALETLPAAPAVEQLAHVAVHDSVPDVRSFAVRALGSIGDEQAIAALARATADSVATVREGAAEELGRLQAVQAFDALVAMFDDPNDDTRWAAVRAVGSLRTEQAIPYLVDALRDPIPQVVNAAERGLQQLGIAKRRPTGFREPEA